MALSQVGLERLNTATTKKIGVNKNLIINGAMEVAQRGTSSTAVGYKTVDRMYGGFANTDEAPTFTQADIGTSDAPYLLGFRKSFKIQNGNQTSGAGASDEVFFTYNIEAQDLAQSGWDYTSSSSNITLSFWVKSSVAQQFQVNMRLYPASGDQKELCFEYTPSANTWTKVTKTIPGAAGNVLRNTNELGMFIQFPQFYGTNFTANSRPFDTWETKNNNQNYKDYATTWYTTDNATWEITGLQLEVGSVATDFEHRSFAQELALCQRYFQQIGAVGQDGTYGLAPGYLYNNGNNVAFGYIMPVMMRTSPTITNGSTYLQIETGSMQTDINSYNFVETVFPSTFISISGVLHTDSGNNNQIVVVTNGPTNGLATLSAEL